MNQDIEILRYLAKKDKQIEKLYNKLIYQLSKVSLNITKIREGAFFSFDDYPEIKKKVDEILDSYSLEQQQMILDGINDAVKLSFKANAVVLAAYSRYSDKALRDMRDNVAKAFISNRMKPKEGLSLSQKVWNYTRQAKAEFEAGMSDILEEGLKAGMSAEELGRQLRDKLQYPDMVYRRYHMKKLTAKGKKDVIEWRRKVIDSEGKVRYIKEDLEKVGRGVYRSSRKNALRLTATEINMAYRYADNARWQSEPFVIGFRIQLSGNHTLNGKPFHDMCDELVGDYPKWFRWAGWHPRCRCIATSILVDKAEMMKISTLPEEEYHNYKSPNLIKKMPDNYNQYVEDNRDRILAAMDKGTLPYWVKDNYKDGDIDKGFYWTGRRIKTEEHKKAIQAAWDARKQKNAIQLAAQKRHANRDAKAIQEAWDKRKRRNAILAAAEKRHANRDAVAIQKAWNERKARYAKLKKIAGNVYMASLDYPWVDTTNLEFLVLRNKYHLLEDEYREVAKKIIQVRIQQTELSKLIPNVKDWQHEFTYAELKTAYDSIERTLNRWKWNLQDPTSLNTIKKGLEYEIKWMSTKGTKYDTWRVAVDAYKSKLDFVNERISIFDIRKSISNEILLLGSSQSKQGKLLVSDFEDLISREDAKIDVVRAKAQEITDKAKQLEKQRKRNSSKNAVQLDEFKPKSKAETIEDFKQWMSSIGVDVPDWMIDYDKGFIQLSYSQHEQIYNALKPETIQEHIQLWNHKNPSKGARWGAAGYVRTGNSFKINGDFRETGVVGILDDKAISTLKAHGMNDDDVLTVKLLDKKIAEFSVPVPLRVTRYVQPEALSNIFGETIETNERTYWFSPEKTVESIENSQKTIQADPAFLSASTNENQNVFTSFDVKLEIEVPPNTPFYLTNNYRESEVVFGRSTNLQFISAKKRGSKVVIRARVKS